jgi:hypothetical protein
MSPRMAYAGPSVNKCAAGDNMEWFFCTLEAKSEFIKPCPDVYKNTYKDRFR